MKNLLLIFLTAILVMYAYVAINERKQEQLIAKRVPQIRKVNRYEFSRALYQIRQARKAIKAKEEEPEVREEETPTLEEDMEYLEKMRNAPSNPARPINEDEFFHRPSDAYQQEDAYQLQQEHEEGETAQRRGRMQTPAGIRIPKRFVDEDQDIEPPAEEEQASPEDDQTVMPSIPLEPTPQQ